MPEPTPDTRFAFGELHAGYATIAEYVRATAEPEAVEIIGAQTLINQFRERAAASLINYGLVLNDDDSVTPADGGLSLWHGSVDAARDDSRRAVEYAAIHWHGDIRDALRQGGPELLGERFASPTPDTAARRHELKTWPSYYQAVVDGTKTFELRRNDRDIEAGDVLVLREWDPEHGLYSGRSLEREVTYVLRNAEAFGLRSGFVILGLAEAGGASVDCAASAGAQVAREQATDRADTSVTLRGWCGDEEPHEPHDHCGGATLAPVMSTRLLKSATEALSVAGFVDPDDGTMPTFQDVPWPEARIGTWKPAQSAVSPVVVTVLRYVADHIAGFELLEDEIGKGPEFDAGMRTAYLQLVNAFRVWADELEGGVGGE